MVKEWPDRMSIRPSEVVSAASSHEKAEICIAALPNGRKWRWVIASFPKEKDMSRAIKRNKIAYVIHIHRSRQDVHTTIDTVKARISKLKMRKDQNEKKLEDTRAVCV